MCLPSPRAGQRHSGGGGPCLPARMRQKAHSPSSGSFGAWPAGGSAARQAFGSQAPGQWMMGSGRGRGRFGCSLDAGLLLGPGCRGESDAGQAGGARGPRPQAPQAKHPPQGSGVGDFEGRRFMFRFARTLTVECVSSQLTSDPTCVTLTFTFLKCFLAISLI